MPLALTGMPRICLRTDDQKQTASCGHAQYQSWSNTLKHVQCIEACLLQALLHLLESQSCNTNCMAQAGCQSSMMKICTWCRSRAIFLRGLMPSSCPAETGSLQPAPTWLVPTAASFVTLLVRLAARSCFASATHAFVFAMAINIVGLAG